MSKRYTDSEIWGDPWYQELPDKLKLFWRYLCDCCDIAGVWKVNLKLAGFHLQNDISESEALTAFGHRIKPFRNGEKWFITSFCEFQYSELNPKDNFHKSIIRKLSHHGINWQTLTIEEMTEENSSNLQPLPNPLQRGVVGTKEKEKEIREKDKERDKEIPEGMQGEPVEPVGSHPEPAMQTPPPIPTAKLSSFDRIRNEEQRMIDGRGYLAEAKKIAAAYRHYRTEKSLQDAVDRWRLRNGLRDPVEVLVPALIAYERWAGEYPQNAEKFIDEDGDREDWVKKPKRSGQRLQTADPFARFANE